MRVDQLNLANFRGFRQLDIQFEPDLNVIAGVNGVGKSAILDALAISLMHALPEFTPSTAKSIPFHESDIYNNQPFFDLSVIISHNNYRFTIDGNCINKEGESEFWRKELEEIRIDIKKNNITNNTKDKLFAKEIIYLDILKRPSEKWHVLAENLSSDTLVSNYTGMKNTNRKNLDSLKNTPNQPIAIFFSSHRQLPDRPRSLPEPVLFRVSSAYTSALQERKLEIREFMHWFRSQEFFASEGDTNRYRILNNLRYVISQFIPEFTNLRIEEKPNLRIIVDKNNVPLDLNQLSDGERGLLAIIFDITRRLSIANPELDDPIAEGQAIILIDEIELHLHPAWQRSILQRFKETFKKCQFIVTTHSPQVLGEVESRCIRFLSRDEEQRVYCWVPPYSFGLDTNRILEELMDVKIRNTAVDENLRRLFRLIDREHIPAAQEVLKKMRQTLGDNDPELTRACALIDFLEGAE